MFWFFSSVFEVLIFLAEITAAIIERIPYLNKLILTGDGCMKNAPAPDTFIYISAIEGNRIQVRKVEGETA